MTDVRESVVEELVETGQWGQGETPRLAERAGYRCEYCGIDLLATVEHYRMFQVDHIIPTSAGGPESFDNKAIACQVCNVNLKGRWNPAPYVRNEVSRDELIETVREYIAERKVAAENELAEVQRIVGY